MQRTRRGQIFVLLAAGFEEYDVIVITRTLRRVGLPVVLVGLTAGPIRGCYGMSLTSDKAFSEIEAEYPLAIILPGGIQGARQLNGDPRVHSLLRRAMEQGGYLVALDMGYIVLHTAEIIDGSEKRHVAGAVPVWQGNVLSSQRVVVDGQMIFGRDSGAAQESALALAALLEGETWAR